MIDIRQASESDAQTLAELGRATFLETFARDNRREDMEQYVAATFGVEKQLAEIRDPRRWIAIAWLGDRAAGFLHLAKGTPDPSVTGAKPVEILRLYVESRWHGKGVGAALMDRALQFAREEGFQTLWLGVWERNVRAQAFYEKYGFAKAGTHVFRLGMADQTDLIMVRAV